MTPRRATPASSAHDLLTTLGRLTAEALNRAELQKARVDLAVALQSQLLPPALPSGPRWRSAARYAPARDGLDVGGDWYDGFRLPDGALGFSIGDVQGHDVEAAAFMGQIRIALRAVAVTTADPGEALSRANDLLLSMDCDLFATCTFVRFDPATLELADARAGHVPAVWATVDDCCGVDVCGKGLPLGIQPGEVYPVSRRRLTKPGAYVLLTDGVIEGPSFPIEAGLQRVTELVRAGAGGDPDQLAAEVIKVADLTGHSDDAAVLVLRHDATADVAA
ncbi:serine/threonine-protein phosphatase [Streptomyces sp. RB6PN25]|uniref:Serine/threonine-protein phosphatase n=1 Tax=Streptomyces humicola TaxID=2953240 RepID=A0ABT1Q6S8_9ACTN|nr:PP2C family protein-serine/threonine phosphatase [Streptomyces humicola]MCQ4084515.1 serine/threonine-protein phosphatase [Streptomyces humicola]